MAINKDTVKYTANLARIELSNEELDHFTGQLDRILAYVDKLSTLNVTSLKPTSHVLKMKNVYREDAVKASLPVSEAIKNAPLLENNLFKVPKIIGLEA
ncbi:MAG: Asp-tRNA(Asn)/Glu-tRNA(Gln) amidotransferase GatCAB subunit C [Candidatus Omnitrophica bacterium CG_4_9_14_0_2_um_filter_42_8]|nr:MAG: Asp-tRNA(Asn)/Glu-tRNA(Gln) amidotransferase GatCAB subunit C [Candidatus Omnitrophica bacterium CG22_combo_CG10-13_8_21_14_all_43_16]PJC48270.1 MAG: Asp-tRNA(Asn)/Glu-tRNA(Gln) amidotransferase GatCAB subunit C [Candidatus Omnitrophica bacterium CG_4_9_14_0_2_um_filter_42_8]